MSVLAQLQIGAFIHGGFAAATMMVLTALAAVALDAAGPERRTFGRTAGTAKADQGVAIFESARHVVFDAIVFVFAIGAIRGFGPVRTVSMPVKAMTA